MDWSDKRSEYDGVKLYAALCNVLFVKSLGFPEVPRNVLHVIEQPHVLASGHIAEDVRESDAFCA